ncbi:hypothetical protein [Salinactinospora qingdaonensis]|uniref:Uncharacterized protein n=1 Tax=Salinactinospora qingdaonensis TaxID=702744 RepID=A0ABP7F573_9ACTN
MRCFGLTPHEEVALPLRAHSSRAAVALWPLALFCALFSAMLVHGVGGALTHAPHSTTPHHGTATASAAGHGEAAPLPHHAAAAEAVNAGVASEWSGSEGHRHVECMSGAASAFVLLIFLFWAFPLGALWPSATSPVMGLVLPSPWTRPAGRCRAGRRLLTELSVLRV